MTVFAGHAAGTASLRAGAPCARTKAARTATKTAADFIVRLPLKLVSSRIGSLTGTRHRSIEGSARETYAHRLGRRDREAVCSEGRHGEGVAAAPRADVGRGGQRGRVQERARRAAVPADGDAVA